MLSASEQARDAISVTNVVTNVAAYRRRFTKSLSMIRADVFAKCTPLKLKTHIGLTSDLMRLERSEEHAAVHGHIAACVQDEARVQGKRQTTNAASNPRSPPHSHRLTETPRVQSPRCAPLQ